MAATKFLKGTCSKWWQEEIFLFTSTSSEINHFAKEAQKEIDLMNECACKTNDQRPTTIDQLLLLSIVERIGGQSTPQTNAID